MLIDAMGLILADNERIRLGKIDEPRSLAAVPFAGRHRIIDFTLSNMVNSGIRRVGIVALTRYKSLMDHTGTGSWWDLDRIRQGLFMIPPYVNMTTRRPDRTDSQSIIDYVESGHQEYVIISGCEFVASMSYLPLLDVHLVNGADITMLCIRDKGKYSIPAVTIDVDDGGRVTDVLVDHPSPKSDLRAVSLLVLKRDLLLEILQDRMARGYSDFSALDLFRLYDTLTVRTLIHDDLLLRITNIAQYFSASMALLDDENRHKLFSEEHPIYTKVKNRAPCLVTPESLTLRNVLASDGCMIRGNVENSVLSRGVVIGRGAQVRNSVLFQDVQISEGVTLDHVIIDKNVVIKMGVRLLGQDDYPIVIEKNAIV